VQLILRRANVSRKGGQWQKEDYDVFGAAGEVGRQTATRNGTPCGASFAP
jgi:hypothetical protein